MTHSKMHFSPHLSISELGMRLTINGILTLQAGGAVFLVALTTKGSSNWYPSWVRYVNWYYSKIGTAEVIVHPLMRETAQCRHKTPSIHPELRYKDLEPTGKNQSLPNVSIEAKLPSFCIMR